MQPVPSGYPVVELAGALIVGSLLNWGLFGTLSVQLYLYYLAFPDDRRITKYLVYGIYVIEFVQTVLVTHDVFATFGYSFGDMDALAKVNFYWLTIPIMGAVAACIGQAFYAYRIFILSKSRIIPIFIICISLINSGASIFTGIYAFEAGSDATLNTRKVHIAVGLMRSTTSFRRTRMLITKIIRLTVETGTVTAVAVMLNFVLFIAFPYQTFYAAPGLLVPKLYANAVYMVLNSRFKIIGGRDTYMSSTDMSFTTTMIGDILSESTEDIRPADEMQGPAPIVVISNEIFNDTCETGQISDKPQDGCMSLPR
ncbi:hypothetical protein IW261DRAFT_1557753 [Armillaria novae-zelandiae]|uniref:DUF6534 domain-containing protein n=1 Tax=Armillaria novae-zelandiae TaxID=153914 RepID=A0AA39PRX9_9AGAR|nr:hypothetical protein IW261DRAFT_1557753 [Armillaria novae-zelandiae]